MGIDGAGAPLLEPSALARAPAAAAGAAPVVDSPPAERSVEDARPSLSRSGDRVLRIVTFTAPSPDSAIHAELRELGHHRWGSSRWVGRRLSDARRAEIAIVSLWDDDAEMSREVGLGQQMLSEPMKRAIDGMSTEVYACAAYGAWKRDRDPCVLRIFRGGLIEGDPTEFDAATAAAYVALFESNPSCVAIAGGIRSGGIALATLWTSWDSIVAATKGELREVLPVYLPGWAVTGTAVHYEIVTAEGEWTSREGELAGGS